MKNIFKTTIATTENKLYIVSMYGAAEALGHGIAAAKSVNVASVEVLDTETGELMLLMEYGALTWICEEWAALLFGYPLKFGVDE